MRPDNNLLQEAIAREDAVLRHAWYLLLAAVSYVTVAVVFFKWWF